MYDIKKWNNYHTHTHLCRHAEGKPVDYCKQAVKNTNKILGMSDHAFMPNLEFSLRMKKEDIKIYKKELQEADLYARLNRLKLYKGFEIEYFYQTKDIYPKYLKDFDYLILGQHYIYYNGKYKSVYKFDSIDDIKLYSKQVVEALNTGYFNLLCHPDLCFYCFDKITDEMLEIVRPIIKTCKKLNIPLEINANGLRKTLLEPGPARYPRKEFFKLVKEEGAKVIISSDCHYPNFYFDKFVLEAFKFAKDLELNLIYELDMNYYKK